jgi:ribosomal protein S18 acetylase RimI-like enzyme
MKIEIRRVREGELHMLQQLSIKTFNETFAGTNTEQNMREYIAQAFSSDRIKTELTNTNSEFYFAESGSEKLGYLKLNFRSAQTEDRGDDSAEIERIYVLQQYHGEGIGQLLLDAAIKRAEEEKVQSIWLGVWEHNPRAIRFYQKNGFSEFSRHIFKLGDDEQIDLMMSRRITTLTGSPYPDRDL